MNLDTLIREVNPAPLDTLPGPESPEARAILEHVRTGPPARQRHRVLVGALTLGTLAVAAAVVLLVAALLPGSPAHPSPAAAAALDHLAEVAALQPAVNPPGPGQYEYTESVETYQSCNLDKPAYCYFLPEHRQIWIGWDGSGRILETFGTPSFVTPTDRANWESSGSPPLSTAPSDTTFGPHTLSDGPVGLASLPTDPSALAAALAAGKLEGVPHSPAEEFVQIGDLLRETDAAPALRAAAYQVAATLPGVEVLGRIADHSGRIGIGVASTLAGVRNELIFDPSTSALLGEEGVVVGPQAGEPIGTVNDWAVYLSSGIVNSLSSTPTGAAPPAPPVSCTAVTTPPTTVPGSPPLPGRAPGSDVYPASCKPGTGP